MKFFSTMLVRIALALPLLLLGCAGQPTANGDFYTVRSGDTLYSLGRAFGQSYHDIAAWNKISDKDEIQVGQVLRIRPSVTAPVTSGTGDTRVAARKSAPAKRKAAQDGDGASDPQPPEAPAAGELASMNWMWPAQGRATAASGHNLKGIDIAGTAGQPVWASAAGKVTYAGHGIRGYGDLIIIKHSRSLLSVYAHNKAIMVTEGQTVNRGQQIAQMGDTDSSTVKLYFEIRGNGKPLNTLAILPKQ